MKQKATDRGRRRFLGGAGAATLWLAAHRQFAWAMPDAKQARTSRADAEARIRSLRLRTRAPLEEMKAFYHGLLGLPLLKESAGELTIGGGATPITFVETGREAGAPFYHFAFNIPENKLRSARDWQVERTPLLPPFPRLMDPDFPDDVIHFRNWNAHSVFFFDPAQNVVEYIARHTLDNAAPGPFSVRDILYASEIAFVVDDVAACGKGLKQAFDLEQYLTASDQFMALGDELGLLLVFKRGRQLGLAGPVKKPADVFRTDVEIRAPASSRHEVPDYPYRIVSAR